MALIKLFIMMKLSVYELPRAIILLPQMKQIQSNFYLCQLIFKYD